MSLSFNPNTRTSLNYAQLPLDIHLSIYCYLAPADLCALLDVNRAYRKATIKWMFDAKNISAIFHKYVGAQESDEPIPLPQRVICCIFESIQQIPSLPLFIQIKLQQKDKILQMQGAFFLNPAFALKGAMRLMKWHAARDTLYIWRQCAVNIKQAESVPTNWNSIEETVQKASKFSKWILDNSSKLSQLKQLYLSNNEIAHFPCINPLPALEWLNLSNNWIVNLTPLSSLAHLKQLFLDSNRIVDLFPLSTFTQLELLYLSNNQIIDLIPLSPLTRLNWLMLSNNQLVNLTPLRSLSHLKMLNLDKNPITDLNPLNPLTQLQQLYLDCNQIADFTPLISLRQLQTLGLPNNPTADLSSVKQLRDQGTIVIYPS